MRVCAVVGKHRSSLFDASGFRRRSHLFMIPVRLRLTVSQIVVTVELVAGIEFDVNHRQPMIGGVACTDGRGCHGNQTDSATMTPVIRKRGGEISVTMVTNPMVTDHGCHGNGGRGARRTGRLERSPRAGSCRQIDFQVDENHHQQRNVERPDGGIDNVPKLLTELAQWEPHVGGLRAFPANQRWKTDNHGQGPDDGDHQSRSTGGSTPDVVDRSCYGPVAIQADQFDDKMWLIGVHNWDSCTFSGEENILQQKY